MDDDGRERRCGRGTERERERERECRKPWHRYRHTSIDVFCESLDPPDPPDMDFSTMPDDCRLSQCCSWLRHVEDNGSMSYKTLLHAHGDGSCMFRHRGGLDRTSRLLTGGGCPTDWTWRSRPWTPGMNSRRPTREDRVWTLEKTRGEEIGVRSLVVIVPGSG